jgi:protein-S-isoprenylcysteine O-methyltransferase Ste14
VQEKRDADEADWSVSKRSKAVSSPWWYKGRSGLFALAYLIGFLGSWLFSILRRTPYVPAYRQLGQSAGAHGVAIAAALALLCMLVAFAVRVWGSSYLSAARVWNAQARTDALLVAGPFRYCRHPLYAANMLLGLGAGAAAPLYGWLFIVFAYGVLVFALLAHEERALIARYGEQYERYRRQCPALLPGIFPVAASTANARPSIRQGIRAESFSGFIILGMAALFIARPYAIWIFVGCYVVGVIVQNSLERGGR